MDTMSKQKASENEDQPTKEISHLSQSTCNPDQTTKTRDVASDTMSKKETSANEEKPMKMGSRFKYDILVFLQVAERDLLVKNLTRSRGILEDVIKELDKSLAVQSQEQIKIRPILQEAVEALLAGKAVVAHSCIRLAITELTATS